MKPSVCHYSFHRTWNAEKWDCNTLAEEVKKIGSPAIDFHVRLLGDQATAAGQIKTALDRSGLELSGLSMGNNFNQEDPEALKKEADEVISWLQVAAEVQAPASRIFGGHIKDRGDERSLKTGFDRIIEGLGMVTRRTGCGQYALDRSSSTRRVSSSSTFAWKSATVCPSTPGAPFARRTFTNA